VIGHQLEQARRRADEGGVELQLVEADMDEPLPFEDGSFDAATSRLGSLVEDSASTVNRICPGCSSFTPLTRSTNLQCGGKIELTRTRLKLARWASRSAISKLVSFSRCRPTPLVRKALVGMNIRESINPLPRAR